MVDAFITRNPALSLPGMSRKVCSAANYHVVENKYPDVANFWFLGLLFWTISITPRDPAPDGRQRPSSPLSIP